MHQQSLTGVKAGVLENRVHSPAVAGGVYWKGDEGEFCFILCLKIRA